jgi:hypothetical protein
MAYGVYQIGEVYARSCVIIGTPAGASTPKRFASVGSARKPGSPAKSFARA